MTGPGKLAFQDPAVLAQTSHGFYAGLGDADPNDSTMRVVTAFGPVVASSRAVSGASNVVAPIVLADRAR